MQGPAQIQLQIEGARHVGDALGPLLAEGWTCDFGGRVAYVPFGTGASGWLCGSVDRWPEIEREAA